MAFNPDVQLTVGDRVEMRKPHPCGATVWVIYRIGADIGLRCTGCERRMLMGRAALVKGMKCLHPAAPAHHEDGST
jgi:hypothetical protein